MSEHASVWLLDGSAVSAAMLDLACSWLGPQEMARHACFLRPERQRQFVLGRLLLRQMLGQLLGMAPAAVALHAIAGQAPRCPAAPRVGLSISHSGPWIACAVSATCAVGLDIEVMDPARDFLALATQVFDADACAALAAAEDRRRAFYRLWSTHEAAIKLGRAVGASIRFPHQQVSIVLCSARVLTARLSCHDGTTAPQLDWAPCAETPAVD